MPGRRLNERFHLEVSGCCSGVLVLPFWPGGDSFGGWFSRWSGRFLSRSLTWCLVVGLVLLVLCLVCSLCDESSFMSVWPNFMLLTLVENPGMREYRQLIVCWLSRFVCFLTRWLLFSCVLLIVLWCGAFCWRWFVPFCLCYCLAVGVGCVRPVWEGALLACRLASSLPE